METLQAIFLLLLASVLLVNVAQRCHVAYPIALVLAGIPIGFIPGLPATNFDPKIILVIVLPPILYYAAFGTAFREFQRNWREIFSLALGLVVFTTLIVGIIFKWMFPELSWALAFAFGAIISPPDAISATTILKRFSMSPRLVSLLEGESMINDASALVLYKITITALLSGSFSLAEGGVEFLQDVVGGAGLGIISGFALQLLSRRFLEPVLGVVFSFTIPFCTFIVANFLGVSGVIAVVVNGLIGSQILLAHHSSLRRVLGYAFWDIFIILLNCFVFILIGLQLKNITSDMTFQQMMLYSGYAALIAAVMTALRFIWVYTEAGIAYLKALYSPNFPKVSREILRDAAIIGWSGMRGIVSLTAALALPYTFSDGSPLEGRNEIIFISFVVILITLLVPGLTLPTLIRWLKIDSHSDHEKLHLIRKELIDAAAEKLSNFHEVGTINKMEFNFLKSYFSSQYLVLKMAHSIDSKAHNIEVVRQHIIQFQRKQLIEMWNRKKIDDGILLHLEQELDMVEVHIARAELK